jgi:hypothetical protein
MPFERELNVTMTPRRCERFLWSAVVLGAILLAAAQQVAAQDPVDQAALEKQRCPKPGEFALVFSFGYAPDDQMPAEDARFEELLLRLKEAGFNTIHCTYTEPRLELCKKHGIKMMVHLLAEQHHVYKSPDRAQAVCEKLRGHPAVWGYNIWNDTFAKTGEGRRRDVNTVRKWDPTHPAYSGTYRTYGMSHLANADLMGYYDFHWKRGRDMHFPHLLAFWNWARERDAWFYSWFATDSGLVGKGNFNRSLYSANTSIGCGLKGILWFLGTDLMNPRTLEWTATGHDIIKVNKEIIPLSKEIARLGTPRAIYSTTITRTANNELLPDNKKEMMPPGLDRQTFPADHWLQPAGGEFLMSVFADPQGQEAVFLANHNAYAEQQVVLKLARPAPAFWFNRKTGGWESLEVKDGRVALTLAPGGGELLRFGK